MAEKRMFARSIVSSDAFITMSPTAQCLYFQLNMSADDDGVVNNPISIMRTVGAEKKDFEELTDRNFLIPLESGVYVIKHWNINNSIRADRKRESTYKKELSELKKQENGAYTKGRTTANDSQLTDNNTDTDSQNVAECLSNDGQVSDSCPANDSQLTDKCPHSIVEDRLDKDSLVESSTVENARAQNLDSENSFVPETLIPNATEYAQKVFDILKLHSLPCCRGNFITFLQRDFKIALQGIHELKLTPDEVFSALENYCKVIELKRQGLSWWESELTFFNLCSGRGKAILRFLPENFNLDDYKKSRDSPRSLPDDRIRLDVEGA